MDGNHVAPLDDLVHRDVFKRRLLKGKRIVGKHVHSESSRDLRCSATDGTKTDNSDRLPGKFKRGVPEERERRRLCPITVPHIRDVPVNLPGQIENQRERLLRHRKPAVSTHVGDPDAPFPRFRQIDVVGSRGDHRDVFQLGHGVHLSRADVVLVHYRDLSIACS